jgi:hypothetical protein
VDEFVLGDQAAGDHRQQAEQAEVRKGRGKDQWTDKTDQEHGGVQGMSQPFPPGHDPAVVESELVKAHGKTLEAKGQE